MRATPVIFVGLLFALIVGWQLSHSSKTFFPQGQIPSTVRSNVSVKGNFAGVSLTIELATTTVARERGLGGRATLAEDRAMLFVFSEDDRYGFWMKDTLIPLDIFWLDADMHVVFIEKNVTPDTYPKVFYPSVPARYVLETTAGFANAHTVALGSKLVLQNSPLVSK